MLKSKLSNFLNFYRGKSSIVKVTYDEALTLVGADSKYQKRSFLIFALQWFAAADLGLGCQGLKVTKHLTCKAQTIK